MTNLDALREGLIGVLEVNHSTVYLLRDDREHIALRRSRPIIEQHIIPNNSSILRENSPGTLLINYKPLDLASLITILESDKKIALNNIIVDYNTQNRLSKFLNQRVHNERLTITEAEYNQRITKNKREFDKITSLVQEPYIISGHGYGIAYNKKRRSSEVSIIIVGNKPNTEQVIEEIAFGIENAQDIIKTTFDHNKCKVKLSENNSPEDRLRPLPGFKELIITDYRRNYAK